MSIQHAIVVGDVLIATWIDRELLLARMGCLPLNRPFRDGVERGDLRVSRNLEHAILPEGATWAHVLDAEPLALGSMDDGFVFVLWNRGCTVLMSLEWNAGEYLHQSGQTSLIYR